MSPWDWVSDLNENWQGDRISSINLLHATALEIILGCSIKAEMTTNNVWLNNKVAT